MAGKRRATSRRRVLRGLATTVAGAAVGAGIGFPYIAALGPRRNIVFIIADALRADNLGKKLANVETLTPAMDELAKRGISCDLAISPSSWTPISMGSIFYDSSPLRVRYSNGRIKADGSDEAIPKTLSEQGYYTGAVSANYLVACMAEQFDDFIQLEAKPGHGGRKREISSVAVNRNAETLLKTLRSSDSFFLYLHYMDTHEPYFCPDPVLHRIGEVFRHEVHTSRIRGKLLENQERVSTRLMTEEAVRKLQRYYDAATITLDASLKRLLTMLDSHGLLEDTLVIASSDHGEEFADNVEGPRDLGHSSNLSQQQIHSPLILWSKKRRCMAKGERIPHPVSTTTVINRAIDEFSRKGHLRDMRLADEDILSSLVFRNVSAASLVSRHLKLVLEYHGGKREVKAFQLGGSRGITSVPLGGVDRGRMSAFIKNVEEGAGKSELDPSRMDEKTQQQLRTLGYIN